MGLRHNRAVLPKGLKLVSRETSVEETDGPVVVDLENIVANLKVEESEQSLPGGTPRTIQCSFPLRQWLDRFEGSYVGELAATEVPERPYVVSLEPWRGRNLDRTWLRVSAIEDWRPRRSSSGKVMYPRVGTAAVGVAFFNKLLTPRPDSQ